MLEKVIYHIHLEIANSPPTTPTQWKTRKRRKKIDDRVTTDTTPAPYLPDSDTPNTSAQYNGSTDSNSPHSLINQKFAPNSTTTLKNWKNKEIKLTINTHFSPPLPLMHPTMITSIPLNKMMAPRNPISPICWEIAINVMHSPPTLKPWLLILMPLTRMPLILLTIMLLIPQCCLWWLCLS